MRKCTASVTVRPALRLVIDQLSPAELQTVSRWISFDEAVIVGYWDETIGTGKLMRRLRRQP